jgi:hypothetical protein
VFTFFIYVIVIVLTCATVSTELLQNTYSYLQLINAVPGLVVVGHNQSPFPREFGVGRITSFSLMFVPPSPQRQPVAGFATMMQDRDAEWMLPSRVSQVQQSMKSRCCSRCSSRCCSRCSCCSRCCSRIDKFELGFGWVFVGHAGGHLLGYVISGAHVFNRPVHSLQLIKF